MTAQTDDRTIEENTEPYYTEERDWFFTFGHGQRLYAQNYRDAESNVPINGQGIHLFGYYVVIHGDFRAARQRMVDLFGLVWCDQYRELPGNDDLPGWAGWTELIKIPPAAPGARL